MLKFTEQSFILYGIKVYFAKGENRMGEVLAVTSGKGGTGKTTISAAVASCLAAEGKRVLCIDADIGLRNLDISLGMSDLATIAFTDVMRGSYRLSDATPNDEIPDLLLLTAPITERAESISPQAFGAMLDEVRKEFDYCIIDAPAGLGAGFELATTFADRVLVVTAPDPASMRDAAGAADRLTLQGKSNVRLVVNRITPKLFRGMRLTVDDVMDEVGLPLIGIVPEDANVVFAAAHNTPLILYTDQGAAIAALHIARRLEGKKVKLMKIR